MDGDEVGIIILLLILLFILGVVMGKIVGENSADSYINAEDTYVFVCDNEASEHNVRDYIYIGSKEYVEELKVNIVCNKNYTIHNNWEININ